MRQVADLRKAIDPVAKQRGFSKGPGFWFMASNECVVTVDLQRSNWGSECYLNIKIHIQGLFGETYDTQSKLWKRVGNVFARAPQRYMPILTLSDDLTPTERQSGLEDMFNDFIVPLAELGQSRSGVIDLHQQGKVFLLPAVRERLYAN
jgi:hypothetical protein